MSATTKLQRIMIAFLLAGTALSAAVASAAPPPKQVALGTPSLSIGGTTTTSIDVIFSAGYPGGAPAGFSLQWMTAADYANNGNTWFASDDDALCKASLSGVPGYNIGNFNRYSLAPYEQVGVRVGDILLDQGASTNCSDNLICDTTYVFRAFSHNVPLSNWARSAFSANATGSTLPCTTTGGGCTLSLGYWKNHFDQWPAATTDLMLGTVDYSNLAALAILNQNVAGGNGLVALAHQLIAMKLNAANGATVLPAVQQVMDDADALIGNLVIPPIGSGFLAPAQTSPLVTALDDYIRANECDED